MKKKNSERVKKNLRLTGYVALIVGIILLASVSVGLALYSGYTKKYDHKFYPHIRLANLELAGLTYMEAYERVELLTEKIKKEGVEVKFLGQKEVRVKLTATITPFEAAGNEYELFNISWQKVLEEAYLLGRIGSLRQKIINQFLLRYRTAQVTPEITFNKENARMFLEDSFKSYMTPAKNAEIVVKSSGEIEFQKETPGMVFDFEKITLAVQKNLQQLKPDPIIISLEKELPKVTTADLKNDLDKIENFLSQAPLTLTWEDRKWEINRATLGSLMTYANEAIIIDPIKFEKVFPNILTEVNADAKEGKFAVETNDEGKLVRINQFQEAQNGRVVDVKETALALTKNIQQNIALRKANTTSSGETVKTVALVVVETQPKFTPENVNNLGIKDLLGTGHSNMGGSPTNRRKNIGRGVELLNGLLIAPDETFSLLNALKPFTEENGYLPELVIKGNKTTPEIGGGLCQIGTTTFRAAMGSGLPILERQNHSYAVSYYTDDRNHQPGTDATIYEPAPDLKFKNDTGNYILFSARIEGNDLYFDFWGVSDGRRGSFTPPETSNWIQPPPLKEIKTTELAPGERKCTENPHAGVTAVFTYLVEFSDGTKKEREFRSVYKPWQAVCLVGETPT